jgi:hypothetical protein
MGGFEASESVHWGLDVPVPDGSARHSLATQRPSPRIHV